MNVLVKLLVAVVLGAVVAWVAGLFLAGWLATLLGVVSGVVFFFSYDGFNDRRL